MGLKRTENYPKLAVLAGQQAGLKNPTPEAVAESPEARDIRDALWAQYRARLADETTYTLRAIQEWLAGLGIRAALQKIHRDRVPVRARRQQLEASAALTRQFLDATQGASESDVYAAARKRVGQVLLEFFLKLGPQALEAVEVGDIVRMMEAVGKLSTSGVTVALGDARLEDLRRTFDAKIDAARAKAGGGRLTDDDVREIREAVFGHGA